MKRTQKAQEPMGRALALDERYLFDCERWAIESGLRYDATKTLTETIRKLKSNNSRLLDALEGCVKWIEPVMDGFLVEEKAKSRINLEKAKALFSECRGKGN